MSLFFFLTCPVSWGCWLFPSYSLQTILQRSENGLEYFKIILNFTEKINFTQNWYILSYWQLFWNRTMLCKHIKFNSILHGSSNLRNTVIIYLWCIALFTMSLTLFTEQKSEFFTKNTICFLFFLLFRSYARSHHFALNEWMDKWTTSSSICENVSKTFNHTISSRLIYHC